MQRGPAVLGLAGRCQIDAVLPKAGTVKLAVDGPMQRCLSSLTAEPSASGLGATARSRSAVVEPPAPTGEPSPSFSALSCSTAVQGCTRSDAWIQTAALCRSGAGAKHAQIPQMAGSGLVACGRWYSCCDASAAAGGSNAVVATSTFIKRATICFEMGAAAGRDGGGSRSTYSRLNAAPPPSSEARPYGEILSLLAPPSFADINNADTCFNMIACMNNFADSHSVECSFQRFCAMSW